MYFKSDLTPLMFSTIGGYKSTIEVLLNRGANPDVMNSLGLMYIDFALIYCRHDFAGYFQDKKTRSKSKGI